MFEDQKHIDGRKMIDLHNEEKVYGSMGKPKLA